MINQRKLCGKDWESATQLAVSRVKYKTNKAPSTSRMLPALKTSWTLDGMCSIEALMRRGYARPLPAPPSLHQMARRRDHAATTVRGR